MAENEYKGMFGLANGLVDTTNLFDYSSTESNCKILANHINKLRKWYGEDYPSPLYVLNLFNIKVGDSRLGKFDLVYHQNQIKIYIDNKFNVYSFSKDGYSIECFSLPSPIENIIISWGQEIMKYILM